MDDSIIVSHCENLDRRLGNVEQILPTLTTKEELRAAMAEAVAPLATREELRDAIAPLATREGLRDAIAPLATREELRSAVSPLATRAELVDLRRHMDVLFEAQRDDIRLLAEHLSFVMSKLDDR